MSSQSAGHADVALLMTQPWAEIERFYRWLVDGGLHVRGMLHLVEQIEASQYARALHAWTSMHDLCIAQTSCTFPCDLPCLRVAPLFDGTIEFSVALRAGRGACRSVPSPLVGEGQGGGESQTSEVWAPATPNPSPQGGGESARHLRSGCAPS